MTETTITLVADGYKAVDYRPYKKGEWFLHNSGPTHALLNSATPYIILEPVETEPAEQAAIKFLNGLGDEIKGVAETVERLTERVAALEGGVKKPLPYGLWNLEGGNWHSSSPFESAGDASRYAHKNFYADWRIYWRVYQYPEDGGMPVELRETPVTVSPGGTNYVYDQPVQQKKREEWGLWNDNLASWFYDQRDRLMIFKTEHEAIRHLGSYDDVAPGWRPYPYVSGAKRPAELEQSQPKLPTLWGVWLESDSRWAGSHIGEGSIAFFRSKVASEKYVSDWGGEARPLPIEELIKDA